MIDFDYLERGLYGLANAHVAGTMAGHLGAAVIAGYFIGEQLPDLPEGVVHGIEGELQRVINGEEAIWFNAKKAGVTPTQLFRKPDFAPDRNISRQDLSAAIGVHAGRLYQSGHDVIFASIGLRAIADHEELATPVVLTGLKRLIDAFRGKSGGRGFYGKAVGWKSAEQVDIPKAKRTPLYENIKDMAQRTIGELIETAAIAKQGFGGLFHLINHAAAVVELNRYASPKIAEQSLVPHHRHLELYRSLPDLEAELGAVTKAGSDPRTAEYWQGMLKRDSARLTHRIKTIYGYHTLRAFIDDAASLRKADDAFLYLMA